MSERVNRMHESDADLLGSVSVLLRDPRQGDQCAGLMLWDRYLPRLTGLARRTLGARRPGIANPDDAVQSDWISFGSDWMTAGGRRTSRVMISGTCWD